MCTYVVRTCQAPAYLVSRRATRQKRFVVARLIKPLQRYQRNDHANGYD